MGQAIGDEAVAASIDPQHSPQFVEEANAEVSARLRTGTVVYLAMLVILAISTRSFHEHPRLMYTSATTLVVGMLFRAVLLYSSKATRTLGHGWWRRLLGVTIVVVAGSVGAIHSTFLVLYGLGSWPFAISMIWAVGLSTAGSVVLAPYLPLVWLHLVSIEGPVILVSVSVGGIEGNSFAFTAVLFVIFLVVQTRRLHSSYWKGLGDRALEAERRRALETLNDAKSRFFAAVSHEIRTPMNAIFGMASLLSETELTDSQREYVRVFKSASNGLLVLLNDLLDFAKIEAGRFDLAPTDFELREVIRAAVDVTRPRAVEKGLDFPLQVSDDLPAWVVGDPARLQQVLINLLSNAVKFTSRGSVSLEVRCKEPAREGIVTVEFAVRDSGIGIPPERQEVIFRGFSQADASIGRRFGGTGLGLTISKALVEKMAGRLTLKSALGQGSTFRVEAPFRIASAPAAHLADAETASVDNEASVTAASPHLSRPLRVLAVDDVPENQFVVGRYLEPANCTLVYASEGRTAFEIFKADHFDLVLMDVQMPEWDGCVATNAIRDWEDTSGRDRTPIVALSADYLPKEQMETKGTQFDDYLTKPISRSKLLKVVERRRRELIALQPGAVSQSEAASVLAPVGEGQ